MATTWCPDLSGDLAAILVDQAHDKFMNRGDQTYNTAIASLNAMDNIELAPYEFDISFDFDATLTPFVRPPRPELNESEFALVVPALPGAAPGFVGNQLTFLPAPESDATPPTLNYGARPDMPYVPVPVAPPAPDDLEVPIEPGYVMPDVPTFLELNLPATPSIDIPQFVSEPPVFIEPPFNETWEFTPEPYESLLRTKLFNALDPMLEARRALPADVEDAIFQKGRSTVEKEVHRSVEQAVSEFASRGFNEPAGMLAGRIIEVRQAGQDTVANFARDAAIKQFEETLANLRLAIAQGASLEGVYIQLHVEEQKLALQAAVFLRESALAVLNYRVTVFNTKMQAHEINARVYETRVRAVLAQIELYKAQLEGELARGQINEQRVRLYEGMLRGVTVMADFYRSRVEAVKVKADIEKLAIDRYKAEIDAYDSRLKAFATEMQGYLGGVEAVKTEAEVYRTLVDANSKRVDAWAAGNSFQIEAEKLRITQHAATLTTWDGEIRRFQSMLEAERGRLAAVAGKADAQARLYAADASLESTVSAAGDRSFQLGLAREEASVNAQLKQADMLLAQAKGLIDQSIAIADAKMRTATQLAASTMTAVGYSAGVSSSKQKSTSCSTNFSFAGETGDA